MRPKLSILLPTLLECRNQFQALLAELERQAGRHFPGAVQFVVDVSEPDLKSYGRKVEQMMGSADGEYVCAVDDGGWVAGCYVRDILSSLDRQPDLVTFDLLRVDLGELWTFGSNLSGRQAANVNLPCLGMRANHLCAWRTETARRVKWMDETLAAGAAWCSEMAVRFPYVQEVHVPKVLYLYYYDPNKTRRQR
jgi:hypothetical protein